MHRVALNLCYDRLRRRREIPDAEAGMTTPDPAPSAPSQILARERAERVRDAMSKLPERQRAAITLCHFQELTNIEAARALDVSVEALESLLARARRALKAALSHMAQDLMGGAESGESA
jgi:RNA polymerase sigma-70 factor (ECF subfamily)